MNAAIQTDRTVAVCCSLKQFFRHAHIIHDARLGHPKRFVGLDMGFDLSGLVGIYEAEALQSIFGTAIRQAAQTLRFLGIRRHHNFSADLMGYRIFRTEIK